MTTEAEGKSKALQKIIIVGGSLSGLMCGIVLKNAGHDVQILEKDADERDSHMAGVGLAQDAEELLERHDRLPTDFSVIMDVAKIIDKDGKTTMSLKGRRKLTSWDILYFHFRANFDGYRSIYCPEPPATRDSDGNAVYTSCTRVLDVARTTDEASHAMTVSVEHRETKKISHLKADLVIGADGPSSVIRAKYQPDCKREHANYVIWRGTVLETDVSPETRNIFDKEATASFGKGNYNIIYMIPGEVGSIQPGSRYINFVWYTVESAESLKHIMSDSIDGHEHRVTVPKGHVKASVWAERLEIARNAPMSTPCFEVMQKIEEPFIQRVTDYCSTEAVFEDGHVILMGDALALFRPHTGHSTNQSSFHALLIEEYLSGKIDIAKMEEKMLEYSRLHWAQSLFWGYFYLGYRLSALTMGLKFAYLCLYDRVKSWWLGQPPLLRTPISKGKE